MPAPKIKNPGTLPSKKEKTKRQSIADSMGMIGELIGFSQAITGQYKAYRKMRNNPTIALARAVAMAPIRLATWNVEVEDDVDEAIKEFVKKEMTGLWRSFIKNVLYAFDYGWISFEKVWDINVDGKLIYKKLKPLLVDRTKILINKETGLFEGLRNISVDVPANKSFLYTYDGESGNFYGRSRHENIRDSAYTHYTGVIAKYGKYLTKISGIIPMIEYPEGISKDATGAEIDNFEIAKKVLQNLGSGFGVTMPNVLIAWAEDAIKSGVDIAKIKAWTISFLETKGTHGLQFVNSCRHFESLMMRGWLVPERVATEGQHGTKAESKVHGDIALSISDLDFEEILEKVNWYLINPLVVYNFGAQYKNKVKLKRAGLDKATRELLSKVIEKVLTAPGNIDLFGRWLDIDAAIENVGLPKAEDNLTMPEREEEPSLIDETKKRWQKINEKLSGFVE